MIIEKWQNKWTWGLMIVLVVVFVFLTMLGINTLDPDFGWHLQLGQLYLQNGEVFINDPFSFTMPSFPFVDHEWLTNLIWGRWYPWIGKAGLAIIYAGLVVAAVLTVIPKYRRKWAIVPVLLGAGILVTRGGVRPQVWSWLMLAGLLRLTDEKIWQRWKWIMVPFFTWWANLHGGFALGSAVLGFILIYRFWENRRINWEDVAVWVTATLATLINPYGIRLWAEVVMQMTDSNLRKSIAEWLPFYVRLELGYWLLAAWVFSLVKEVKKISNKTYIWLAGILFSAGLSSLRHMPLFMIAVLPVAAELTERLFLKIRKIPFSIRRWKIFWTIMVIISGLLFLAEMVGNWRFVIKSSISYPEEGINYLRTQNYQGNLMSNYGWGGYLIWKYPEKKVFVDGRMPSWRWVAPKTESNWVFKEYQQISDKGDRYELFNKYNIRTVLWNKNNIVLATEPKWWSSLKRKLGIKNQTRKDILSLLQENRWNKVYEDNICVIYRLE